MKFRSDFSRKSLLVLSMLCACVTAGAYDLTGVWASEGYGRIIQVSNNTVSIFGVTSMSCVWREDMSLDDFVSRINRINRSEEDWFSFYDEGGITRYDYRKIASLPTRCKNTRNAKPNRDPELNFEVFWNSFNENYAFFDTHDVDWDAVYLRFRPKVTAMTSDAELYQVLSDMISVLDDRHVSLTAEGFPRRHSGHPGTLQKLLQKELPQGEEPSRERIRDIAKAVIAEDYLKNSRKEAIGGEFTWGWAADGIAYFSVDSMWYGSVLGEGATLRDSLREVDKVMDRVIRDLDGAQGFIVDARWNGGGEDSNALQIAGHFTDQQLLALTKRARNGGGLTPEQEVFIPSHAVEKFAGPVVYLCSRDTLSAAEIFSMAMLAMPNVTSLGEPTVGALSDTHSVYLPNGWEVRMSNEIYKAVDGKVYESLGIPVDVYLPPPDDATLESYIRLGIDEAIALLRAK
jgi:hypothetical protein